MLQELADHVTLVVHEYSYCNVNVAADSFADVAGNFRRYFMEDG